MFRALRERRAQQPSVLTRLGRVAGHGNDEHGPLGMADHDIGHAAEYELVQARHVAPPDDD